MTVSREAMGKVLRYYGVPEGLVKLVKDLHEGMLCKVNGTKMINVNGND